MHWIYLGLPPVNDSVGKIIPPDSRGAIVLSPSIGQCWRDKRYVPYFASESVSKFNEETYDVAWAFIMQGMPTSLQPNTLEIFKVRLHDFLDSFRPSHPMPISSSLNYQQRQPILSRFTQRLDVHRPVQAQGHNLRCQAVAQVQGLDLVGDCVGLGE